MKTKITLAILLLFISNANKAVDRQEGGYVGSGGQIAVDCVWNFIKHFNYEQYYWGVKSQFTSNNNYRVDAVDFAFYCGHGSAWNITMSSGPNVDISTAGNTSQKGWGDNNAEFIAFESCDVVPSPLEVTDWWSNWVKDGAPFDGLHQAVGWRTVAYFANCREICDEFGYLIHVGLPVWQSWFDAINAESDLDEMGCAVMNPTCNMDSHAVFAADPAASDKRLHIWYQY